MIFVTVGSAVKGIEFTRLIKKMDEIAGKIEEEVIMQIGTVPYEPKNAKYFRYTSYQENLSYFQKASLVVGHGGTGTILNAVKFHTPIVVVPRRHHYREHVDDHQLEMAKRIEGIPLVYVVYELDDLENKVRKIRADIRTEPRIKLIPEREKLIETIKRFVRSVPERTKI